MKDKGFIYLSVCYIYMYTCACDGIRNCVSVYVCTLMQSAQPINSVSSSFQARCGRYKSGRGQFSWRAMCVMRWPELVSYTLTLCSLAHAISGPPHLIV